MAEAESLNKENANLAESNIDSASDSQKFLPATPTDPQRDKPVTQTQNGFAGFVHDLPPPKPRRFKKWKFVVVGLLVAAIFTVGLLIGYIMRANRQKAKVSIKEPCVMSAQSNLLESASDELDHYHKGLMDSMSGERIATLLRNFTQLSVYSSSASDLILSRIVGMFFQKSGLDTTVPSYTETYDCLLSFPNRTKPNLVIVLSLPDYTVEYLEPSKDELLGLKVAFENMTASGKTMSMSDIMAEMDKKMKEQESMDEEIIEGVMLTPEQVMRLLEKQQSNPDFGIDPAPLALEAHLPYAAYSSPGVAMGEPIYLNYGRHEDMEYADRIGVQLKDRIAVIRMGHGRIAEKVREAVLHEMVGVLLYEDPIDMPHPQPCTTKAPYTNVFDEDIGDPLTPGYPSIEGMLRMTIGEANLPKIPVQTISCVLAKYLLTNITGKVAPASWQGGLDLTYEIGRRRHSTLVKWTVGWFSDKAGNEFNVRIENNNVLERKNVTNVIGRLHGYQDPDEYVIIGANRNHFSKGNHSGVMGTATLLEFTRNLAILIMRHNWRPKKTLVFASWGGGDFGNMGMVEFIQQYKSILQGRVVSYIDLDDPVVGNYIISATASAAVEDLLYNVAQKVPSPDDKGKMYDIWAEKSGRTDTDGKPGITRHYQSLQRGHSDPFYTLLSAPSIHIQYLPASMNPATATSAMDDITDEAWMTSEREHHYHHYTAVSQMVALLTLSLTDATIVQFDPHEAAVKLRRDIDGVISSVRQIAPKTADAMVTASSDLITSSRHIDQHIMNVLDFGNEAQRRLFNQRLIDCEKHIAQIVNQLYRIRLYFDGSSIAVAEGSVQRAVNTSSQQSPVIPASFIEQQLSLLLHSIQMAVQSARTDFL